MKLIPLTQGKFAQVDDEDYDFLMQWKWSAVYSPGAYWYAIRNIRIDGKRTTIKMHRVIMKVENPDIFVDHIIRDGLNNQKENLRVCNSSENCRNRKKPRARKYTSKYKGVYFCEGRIKPWRMGICCKGMKIPQLSFITEIEAAVAYNEAAKKYHGEFANLNIIENEKGKN